MSSDEVRLFNFRQPVGRSLDGEWAWSGWTTHGRPGGPSEHEREFIALPAAKHYSMAADARAYRCLLQALKTGENAKLTFGQVMADLGLDDPDGQPRVMEVRFGRK